MDMVSRLWLVIENDKNAKIVYDGKDEIKGIYLEFFRLLGLSTEQIICIDEVY